MDLRQYFRKIREVEATVTDQYPVVTSLETPDGGKAGRITEVPRAIAAKMIVEGRAMLATDAEREQYREQQEAAKAAAEKAELAKRVQVSFVSESRPNYGSNRKVNVPLEK